MVSPCNMAHVPSDVVLTRIVQETAASDPRRNEALATLISRHEAPLEQFCAWQFPNVVRHLPRTEWGDVSSFCLDQIFAAARSFRDGEAGFRSYLRAIVHHRFADVHRTWARRPCGLPLAEDYEAISLAPGPCDLATCNEAAEAVLAFGRECARGLDARSREVFFLCHVLGARPRQLEELYPGLAGELLRQVKHRATDRFLAAWARRGARVFPGLLALYGEVVVRHLARRQTLKPHRQDAFGAWNAHARNLAAAARDLQWPLGRLREALLGAIHDLVLATLA